MDETPLRRRILRATVAAIALVALPAALGSLLADGAAPAMVFGAVGTFVTSRRLGTRTALAFAPAVAAAFVLGGWSHATWWWVTLVGALAAAAIPIAERGHAAAHLVVVLAAVVAPAGGSVDRSLSAGALLLVAAGYGALLAACVGAPGRVKAHAVPPALARRFGAVFIGAMVGAAALALVLDRRRGYWMPMTVAVLFPAIIEGDRSKLTHRIGGTLAGVAPALAAAALGMRAPVTVLLVGIAVVASLVVSSPYWVTTACTTFGVVLALGGGADTADIAGRRLAFTILGAGVLSAIAALTSRLTTEATAETVDTSPSG